MKIKILILLMLLRMFSQHGDIDGMVNRKKIIYLKRTLIPYLTIFSASARCVAISFDKVQCDGQEGHCPAGGMCAYCWTCISEEEVKEAKRHQHIHTELASKPGTCLLLLVQYEIRLLIVKQPPCKNWHSARTMRMSDDNNCAYHLPYHHSVVAVQERGAQISLK